MPCEIIQCTSPSAVHEYAETADVILVNSWSHVSWLSEVRFITDLPALTGAIYDQVWVRKVTRNTLQFDVRIGFYRELMQRFAPHWMEQFFWSPYCVDIREYGTPRDIDTLFWGKSGSGHKFRNFVDMTLRKYCIGEGEKVDSRLTMHDIVIGEREYRHARLMRKPPTPYRGDLNLYPLIGRTKICPTGPAHNAPVAKFFENAACGAVNLTCDFTDREALGFEHKKNIWITDMGHFTDDLVYLLEHDDIREEISRNARELIETRHTPAIRAQELYEFLCKRSGVV